MHRTPDTVIKEIKNIKVPSKGRIERLLAKKAIKKKSKLKK